VDGKRVVLHHDGETFTADGMKARKKK
jgi:hypothetical protein